jgi:hypothetical protein
LIFKEREREKKGYLSLSLPLSPLSFNFTPLQYKLIFFFSPPLSLKSKGGGKKKLNHSGATVLKKLQIF